MPRGLLISGIGLLMLLTGHVRSQLTNEKQPVVKGKTASEWIDILEKDQKVERRRAALIALGILGPKVPGVITGVSSGLNDSDAIVRRSAAQTLGEMGPGPLRAPVPWSLHEAIVSAGRNPTLRCRTGCWYPRGSAWCCW